MLSTVGAMAAVAKAASTAYYYAEHFGVFNREAKGEAETRSVEVAENQSANVGIHLFNGIGYDIWSSKMKSLFLSQDLWDMVEGGYIEEELTVEVLREVRKKDAMALLFIQQAIDKSVFSCITGANKSKEAWDALQKKYEGDGMTKSTKVYVANLSESTTKKDLREAFGYFGKIASTVVVRDEDGKSKCFGFVNFKDADNASWSIEVLNGHKFDDKEWCVRRYQKKSVKRAKNKSVDESVANASKSKKAGNAVSEKKITGKPEKQSVDESLPSSSAKDTCSQLVEPWGVTLVTMPTPSASSVAGSSSTVVAAPSSSHTVTAPVLHDEAVVPSRRPGRGRGAFQEYPWKRNFYKPSFVSIGPKYSKEVDQVKDREYKKMYLKSFLKKAAKYEEYKKIVENPELMGKDKHYYEETAGIAYPQDDEELVEMLVLDGCFVVEFVLKCKEGGNGDPRRSVDGN
nr:polyadenylate-binding protein 2-like [Ipomoea batatas]